MFASRLFQRFYSRFKSFQKLYIPRRTSQTSFFLDPNYLLLLYVLKTDSVIYPGEFFFTAILRIARNEKMSLTRSCGSKYSLPDLGPVGAVMIVVFNQQKHKLGRGPHCCMYCPCTKMEKKTRYFWGRGEVFVLFW